MIPWSSKFRVFPLLYRLGDFVLYLFEPGVISVIKLSYIYSYLITAVFFRTLIDTCYVAG